MTPAHSNDELTEATRRKMDRLRLTLRLSALLFVLIGLACAALSLPNGISELNRAGSQSVWVPVDGRVSGYVARPESFPFQQAPIPVRRPLIDYEAGGQKRSYLHPRATDLDYPVGATVRLRVDPDDPAQVTYDRGRASWLAPLALGTLPLIFGLTLGAVMWRRSGDPTFLRTAVHPETED